MTVRHERQEGALRRSMPRASWGLSCTEWILQAHLPPAGPQPRALCTAGHTKSGGIWLYSELIDRCEVLTRGVTPSPQLEEKAPFPDSRRERAAKAVHYQAQRPPTSCSLHSGLYFTLSLASTSEPQAGLLPRREGALPVPTPPSVQMCARRRQGTVGLWR